jgi:hypothetical protein
MSIGSVASAVSLLSALSRSAVMSFRSTRAVMGSPRPR